MSSYILECSVCGKQCETRLEWLYHLLEPSHQKIAQREVNTWNTDLKTSSIVVFTTFPISNSIQLLQFFSEGADIVTDFVPLSRPFTGLLQFESLKKVKEILKRGSSEVRIDNQLVQLRKAADYLDLEWKALLPGIDNLDLNLEKTLPDNPPRKCSEKRAPNSTSAALPSSLPASFEELQETEEPESDDKPLKKVVQSKKDALWTQFKAACRLSRIGDYRFQTAVSVAQLLRKIFLPRFPSCQVYLFRHWYLQMWSAGTNELLYFVDFTGRFGTNPKSKKHLIKYFQEFLASLEGNHLPSGFIKLPQSHCLRDSKRHLEPRGIRFKYEPENLNFSLLYQTKYLVETQTCRLLQYLTEFDPRVKPLLSWVFSWTLNFNLPISPYICPKANLPSPEPAALEMTVIYFLCEKGILPTPLEIQRQPHIKIGAFGHIDIGFTADMNFAQEWREKVHLPEIESTEFVLNVLELARDYFSFMGNEIPSESFYLNTSHCEILKVKDLLNKAANLETKMSQEELSLVRGITEARLHRESDNQRMVFITHPLTVTRILPVLNSMFNMTTKQMEKASQALNEYLLLYQPGVMDNNFAVTKLTDLLNLNQENSNKFSILLRKRSKLAKKGAAVRAVNKRRPKNSSKTTRKRKQARKKSKK